MSIKVRCLSCGHIIELDDVYGEYDGEIRCWSCRALMEVTFHEDMLKAMKIGSSTESAIEKPTELNA